DAPGADGVAPHGPGWHWGAGGFAVGGLAVPAGAPTPPGGSVAGARANNIAGAGGGPAVVVAEYSPPAGAGGGLGREGWTEREGRGARGGAGQHLGRATNHGGPISLRGGTADDQAQSV